MMFLSWRLRCLYTHLANMKYSFHKSQMDLLARFLVTLISNSQSIFRSNVNNTEADT